MEDWELDFEKWWSDQVGSEGDWTSLERLAAKNAWEEAFKRYSNGMDTNKDYKREYTKYEDYQKVKSLLEEAIEIIDDLKDSACYWSDYDVPIGIVDRINAFVTKATMAASKNFDNKQ